MEAGGDEAFEAVESLNDCCDVSSSKLKSSSFSKSLSSNSVLIPLEKSCSLSIFFRFRM